MRINHHLKDTVFAVISVVAAVLLLAGCGGGGGGGGVSVNAPPMEEPSPPSPPPAEPTWQEDLPADYLAASLNGVETASVTAQENAGEVQWNIKNSKANLAHWTLNGTDYIRGKGVTVAVMDTGILQTHSDLSMNITTNGHDPSTSSPGSLHGTHVAGIIGARLNDDGVVGVAPEATLLPINYNGPGATIGIAGSYEYAIANHAFVVNNSWGVPAQRLKAGFAGMTAWIRAPQTYFLNTDDPNNITLELLRGNSNPMINALENNDMLAVFGHGNDGWNSETGVIYTYANYTDNDTARTEVTLSEIEVTNLTIYGGPNGDRSHYDSTIAVATVSWGENRAAALNRTPFGLLSPDNQRKWINVVATDENNVIADFSNGCGTVATPLCMAAPGVDVTSTIPYYTSIPGGIPADPAEEAKGTTGPLEGTSMSAPHVSGAAALLKGAFPNLTAVQVVDILLNSADGAGRCAGETSKATVCLDDVYGHGILNVEDAFTPTSYIRAGGSASGSAGAVRGFNLRETRINLSPAFGAARWRDERLNIGGLDNYGRVFYTLMDLSDGVWVTRPAVVSSAIAGGAVHAAYGAPLAYQPADYGSSALERLSAFHYQSPAGAEYGVSGGGGGERRYMALADGVFWQHRRGRDSGGGRASSARRYWQPPFDSGEAHQLKLARGIASAAGAEQHIGALYGGGDGVTQAALSWQLAGGGWQLRLEGGVLRESATALGADFQGGFALDGARTHYQRAAGSYAPAAETRLFAEYIRGSSRAAPGGGMITGLAARSDEWSLGAELDRWRLAVSQPLAITRGSMDLSYITGYAEDGSYALENKTLDLDSVRRPAKLSLLYDTHAAAGGGGARFIAGVDFLRNAPSRAYRGDALQFSAALRYTF